MAAWLLPTVLMTARPVALVGTVLGELRRRNIVLPPAATIERLCRKVRHQARNEPRRG
jgi:hypothetical protein